MSIFQSLVEYFKKPEDEGRVPHPHLLRVVMLLETAHLDDDFSNDEREVIQKLLSDKYGLNSKEIESLHQMADERREGAHDIYHFTREINQRMSKEEKIELLTEIWQVILADGVVDKYEDHLAGRLKTLFRLDRADWAVARQRAQKRKEP